METICYQPTASGARLVIVENDEVRVCELDLRPQWSVGRVDPNTGAVPDIPFSSRICLL